MNMTRDRAQSIVWAFTIIVGAALLLALTFRVNAVKSQVKLTERRILALKQEKLALDTEFLTRSNQQQLASLNDVEFGFQAPDADQYVAGAVQLAALARPVAPAPLEPAPVLLARADVPAAKPGALPAAIAPIAHQALATVPATRMLSQHGEKLAGTVKLTDGKLAAGKLALAAKDKSTARKSTAGKLAADQAAAERPSRAKPRVRVAAADAPGRLVAPKVARE